MAEISAELIGGPYDGQTGRLQYADEPLRVLSFSLADRDASPSGLILPSASSGVDDRLTALYVRVEEKPRKVVTYDESGRAHSEKGVRYRYDRNSPVQGLFEQADRDAQLEVVAREQVDATRRLLLADSWEQARKSRRDVERVGDLVETHVGRLVSIAGGAPCRFDGMRRDFTRDGGVVLKLDGHDVEQLVDTPVLLLDEREA